MKPRTKFQLDVIARSKELTNIADFMRAWVKNDCLKYKGYATKNRVVCLQCGESFSPDHVSRGKAVCPHCSTMLEIEVTRKFSNKEAYYSAFAQIAGEYQVVRYFIHYCYYNARHQAKINSWEVMQIWLKENGKCEIVGMNHLSTNYCDTWTGDFYAIRNENQKYYSYYGGLKYNLYADFFHPKSKIKSIYTKYGINTKLEGLTFLQATKIIPQNPHLETLLKCKQYELLHHFKSDKILKNRYWSAIKICIRNKYKVKDASMWVDYVDLLLYFRKDIHNAKYVCPANLKKEHDRLVKKKRELQKRRQIEEKRKKAKEMEAEFQQLKAHLLGIEIKADKLTIKTLDSVQEYLEEGDALSHCVFTNEYFLKKDSLCLSARIQGEPVETIELSLKDMKVVQCRGLGNKNTEYHDQILQAVKKGIGIIKKRIKSQPEHVQLAQ